MLSALRSTVVRPRPAQRTLINLYTTVAHLTRTNWKTGAHPAPEPLRRDTEDEDWPQPQVESLEPEEEADDAHTDSRFPRSHRPFPRTPELKATPGEYAAHRATMKKMFPQGWQPARKISREAMEKLRELHQLDPRSFSTPVLADKFRISPEAVRRILKSKWEPTREQKARMAERERNAQFQRRMERKNEEKRKHEELQEEYGIVSESRKHDRLSLT